MRLVTLSMSWNGKNLGQSQRCAISGWERILARRFIWGCLRRTTCLILTISMKKEGEMAKKKGIKNSNAHIPWLTTSPYHLDVANATITIIISFMGVGCAEIVGWRYVFGVTKLLLKGVYRNRSLCPWMIVWRRFRMGRWDNLRTILSRFLIELWILSRPSEFQELFQRFTMRRKSISFKRWKVQIILVILLLYKKSRTPVSYKNFSSTTFLAMTKIG